MLLKTTIELKKYFSSIDKDYYFGSLESFVLDAELDYIIPEIGQAQYDKVLQVYNAGAIVDPKLLQLHTLFQKAITHLALFLNSDSGSFRISDAGYYVMASTDIKPVSDKKMMQFRKSRAEAGYKALDQAILLMEQNINDQAFSDYKDSEVRKAAGGYFITGPVDFTRSFSPLKNSGTTFRAMLSSIDQAELRYISPLLGVELFEDLKSKILEGDLADPEKILIGKIQKPLAYFSVAEAIPMTGFEYDGKTFSVNAVAANNDNIETTIAASDQRLSSLMNKCVMNGQTELARLKTYLDKNVLDFPLYQVSATDDQDLGLNDVERGFMYF